MIQQSLDLHLTRATMQATEKTGEGEEKGKGCERVEAREGRGEHCTSALLFSNDTSRKSVYRNDRTGVRRGENGATWQEA